MCFFFSFLPATFWATVGYFVLFASSRTEGGLAKFGRILAIWIFIIAAFFPICGAYATLAGVCPIDLLLGLFNSGG
ncbi:MAG: hypothetical protein V3W18_13875 [candidate division Zixibacteria bacterium]